MNSDAGISGDVTFSQSPGVPVAGGSTTSGAASLGGSESAASLPFWALPPHAAARTSRAENASAFVTARLSLDHSRAASATDAI